MATEKAKLAGQRLVKKLTIKTLVGGKMEILAAALTGREGKANKGDPVPLVRIIGQVTGYKTGTTDLGDFVELRGSFLGTNLVTGEQMDNVSRAIMPDVVGDAVAAAIKGGAEAAQFAVEIDVTYDEAAATSYVYSVRSLLKVSVAAPVLGIMAQLASEGIAMTPVKQLAAPKLSDADRAAAEGRQKAADERRGQKTPAGAKV